MLNIVTYNCMLKCGYAVFSIIVLEPRCDRAAWVPSRFEPQELIDVQLERQLATRYFTMLFSPPQSCFTPPVFVNHSGLLQRNIE